MKRQKARSAAAEQADDGDVEMGDVGDEQRKAHGGQHGNGPQRSNKAAGKERERERPSVSRPRVSRWCSFAFHITQFFHNQASAYLHKRNVSRRTTDSPGGGVS